MPARRQATHQLFGIALLCGTKFIQESMCLAGLVGPISKVQIARLQHIVIHQVHGIERRMVGIELPQKLRQFLWKHGPPPIKEWTHSTGTSELFEGRKTEDAA